MTSEEVRSFLYNPANVLRCTDCPMNGEFTAWPENRLPCGQFHCWVFLHCEVEDEEDDDDDDYNDAYDYISEEEEFFDYDGF